MDSHKLARTIGLLIIATVILAPFSMVYVPAKLVVANDAALTFNNIAASGGLFRAGMVSDALIMLIEIALSALLYMFLKPVNQTLALVATFARLAMSVIQGVNLLNHVLVLLVVGGASRGFQPDQAAALVQTFVDAHEIMMLIWGLCFGLHLAVLGYLVYRSGFIPRFVGVVLMLTAACYFIQSFGILLVPQSAALFKSIGMVAIIEIVFPIWLLTKGSRKPRFGALQRAE